MDLTTNNAIEINMISRCISVFLPHIMQSTSSQHNSSPPLFLQAMGRSTNVAKIRFFFHAFSPFYCCGDVRVTNREQMVATNLTFVHIFGGKLPRFLHYSRLGYLR